ncbi:MAG TPA: hypothetical protein EYG85_03050 [Crocinitomix sp.]|nr:hypothetical protein [Crocinitomix sp.]
MKNVFYIVSVSIVLFTCKRIDYSFENIYSGNWTFEVIYLSLDDYTKKTISVYEGRVVTFRHKVTFYYGISDYIVGKIKPNGTVYDLKENLLGVIEPETCLLDFSKEDYQIIIKGFKKTRF